jgi:hypothetical protein
MLTFGVLANAVENFAQGRIGLNFMPSFDDFSLWDDVVHPFFLSVAVYLVCFGLSIAVIFGAIMWELNRFSSTISDSSGPASQTEILTDPNSPFKRNTAIQKQKDLYGDGQMPDGEKLAGTQKSIDEEEEFRKLDEMITQHRKQQLEAGLGKMPETEAQKRRAMIKNLTARATPILIVCLLSLLWGIFYFPAACCVAGYTRSFVSTLNPAVGLETIRLLGFDYVKIWLMGLILAAGSFFAGMILHLILSPFALPAFGNLPATAVGALFSFYISVVFSVVLGFALYKNADKLNLFKS